RPTDRLFVDREHLDTARTFLAQLADEARQGEPDIDELFAGIVADFDTEALEVTWPAAEDLGGHDEDDDEDTDHEPEARGLTRWRRSTVDPAPFNEPDLVGEGDEDEGYTPPPPPPLPRISAVSILAVLG